MLGRLSHEIAYLTPGPSLPFGARCLSVSLRNPLFIPLTMGECLLQSLFFFPLCRKMKNSELPIKYNKLKKKKNVLSLFYTFFFFFLKDGLQLWTKQKMAADPRMVKL